ncbi:LysR family transcriptional regulator [Photobacterium sanctipauli]|uniref:LysR family transcriptional regulator n=1 Tax=Photobacterium sanctipauli TaxID=1342794 RepID=A0A2T3NPY6_9GAMM|nr:LysR family transcriptional regulator [Photobacterium sanctipauli]PSW18333.1 LysR family transcriptional regulator [Photobacterium sanctipauli]
MKIQIENIHSFIAAAETGSFSAAGRKINKTQAAISQSIQNLEIDLGYQLFDRTKKYPILTDKGERMYKNAKTMISQYDIFIDKARALYTTENTQVNLGIDPLTCCSKVQDLLIRFSETFDNIEIKLTQQNSQSLIQKLKDKQLDMVLGLFPLNQKKDFHFTTAFSINTMWVASPGFIKKHGSVLSYGDFCNTKLLLPCSDLAHMGLDEIETASHCWNIEDMNTLLNLCKRDMGVTLLPDFVIQKDLAQNNLQRVTLAFNDIEKESWKASMLWSHDMVLSEPYQWLHDQLLAIHSN